MKQFWMAMALVGAVEPVAVRAQLQEAPRSTAGPAAPAPATTGATALSPDQQARMAKARQLMATLDALYNRGKPQDAIPVAKEIVKICRDVLGDDRAETAFAIHQLAYFYDAVGDHENSRKCNERALAIRRKVLGDNHPHTALSLHNLGRALFGLQRYAEALACHKEALTISEATLGKTSAETFRYLGDMGYTLAAMGDHEAARAYYERALATRKDGKGADDPETAGIERHLAATLVMLKDYAAARPYLERDLQSLRKARGDQDPQTVHMMVVAADSMKQTKDLMAARAQYEQALTIIEKNPGVQYADAINVRNGLGATLIDLGDFPAARRYYEQALAMLQKASGGKDAQSISVLVSLGHLSMWTSELFAAQSYYERVLAATNELYGEGHYNSVHVHTSLALLFASMGNDAASHVHFDKALAIVKESFHEEDAVTSYLFHELGRHLVAHGNNKKALDFLGRALEIRRRVLGETDPKTANTLDELCIVYINLGEFAAARKCVEESLLIRKKILPQNHPDKARGLDNLGYVLHCQGDYAAAIECYQQALSINQENLGDNDARLAGTFVNLATTSAASADWAAAARYQDKARRIVRYHVGTALCALGERDQLAFLAHVDRVQLSFALSMALKRRGDPTIAALSAGWVLNSKALTQDVLAERAIVARESSEPKLAGISKKLAQLRAQQSRLTFDAPVRGGEGTLVAERTRVASTEEDLSRQLAQAGSQSVQAERWIEVEQAREKLAPQEVLIDIVCVPEFNFDAKGAPNRWQAEHYAAWIVPPAGKGNVRLVDLGEAEAIDRAIVALRVAIKQIYKVDPNTGRIARPDPEAERLFNTALVRLSHLVLHPIVNEIGQAKHLVISPDSGLWLVPWAALLLPDGRFAVEDYQIRHVISGRDLVAAANPHKPGRPMIVSNPNFDLTPDEAARIAQAVLSGSKLQGSGPLVASRMKPPLPRRAEPLDGFARQARLVAPKLASYAGKQPGVFQGDQALEALVKAVHRPQVVLFATHGFFEPERPMTPEERAKISASLGMSDTAQQALAKPPDNPLLHCGVLLAGCNWRSASNQEDGILTGTEIVGMDLRGTELVVLSACDTGVGEVRTGEGVAGVRQAFQLAGAQAVVATLWPVFVKEATDQMIDFFDRLAAGDAKAEALRNAQLASIKRLRQEYQGAPPLIWAAFTITGKGR